MGADGNRMEEHPWAGTAGETDDDLEAFWRFYRQSGHRETDPEAVTRWHVTHGEQMAAFDWIGRAEAWDVERKRRMLATADLNRSVAECVQEATRAARVLRTLHRETGGLMPEHLSALAFTDPVEPPAKTSSEPPAPSKKKKPSSTKKREPVSRPECGTTAGKKLHADNGERQCGPCRGARAKSDGPKSAAGPAVPPAPKAPTSPIPAVPSRIDDGSPIWASPIR